MARLQWNPVQAPNFSGVNDTFRLASELGGRSAADIQRAFTRFQDADQNAADSIIRQRLAGIQSMEGWDPNAVLGSEGGRASQEVLNAVTARPQTLLAMDSMRGQESRAQAQEGRLNDLHPLEVEYRANRNIFDKNRDARDQLTSERQGETHRRNIAALDATAAERRAMQDAAPLIQQAYLLRASGDTKGADALMSDPRIGRLSPQQFNSAINTLGLGTNEAERRFNSSASEDLYEFYERGGGMGTGEDERIARQMAEEGNWDPRRTMRMLQAAGGQQAPQRGTTAPSRGTPGASIGSNNAPLNPNDVADGRTTASARVMDTINLATDQHIAKSGIANLVPKYEGAMEGTPSYATAAKVFVEEFGGDPGVVANLLRDMPGNIPIAARAAILENSLKSRTEGRPDFQDYFTGGHLGSGAGGLSAYRPDQRDIDRAVMEYNSDATQTQIVNNKELRRSQTNVQNISDQVGELDALIAQTMNSGRGNTSSTLDRLIQRRDQAAARLTEAEKEHSRLMGTSTREDGGPQANTTTTAENRERFFNALYPATLPGTIDTLQGGAAHAIDRFATTHIPAYQGRTSIASGARRKDLEDN